MTATHVSIPARCEAFQMMRLWADDRGEMWAELSDGSTALLNTGMCYGWNPSVGDYHVVDDAGRRIVAREEFERTHTAIGQNVSFIQDRETAASLNGIAHQIEDSGMKAEMLAVVVGAYGGMVKVFTINSGIESAGLLALGQRIMLDTIAPKPATTGE